VSINIPSLYDLKGEKSMKNLFRQTREAFAEDELHGDGSLPLSSCACTNPQRMFFFTPEQLLSELSDIIPGDNVENLGLAAA